MLDPYPSISAIMAVHNGEKTIDAAIRSMQGQTLDDWELIVVDDASDDQTVSIVRSFMHDTRIKLIQLTTNQGAGAARNAALQAARASLIAIADADDISHPRRFEAQLREFQNDPAAEALGGQMREFGDWETAPGYGSITPWPTQHELINARLEALMMPIPHPTMMIKKHAVVEAGGYPEYIRRAEDYGLLLQLRDINYKMLAEVLIDYRTTRPLPVRYALVSGRDALRVRQTLGLENRSGRLAVLRADVRSLLQWLKRRVRER